MSNTTKELRTMPAVELRQRLAETQHELSALRLKAHQGPVEQPHRIRQMRRDLARLLTVLAESVEPVKPVESVEPVQQSTGKRA